jgi:thiosulfate dehydrogenase [quinone] large subunit
MVAAAQTRDPNALALAVLRICVGALFLIFAEYKVFGTQFTLHGGFQFWINRFIEDGAYPFMKPLLKNFVLAHATPLAFFVAYGELAIGLSLVSGILVRISSFFGLLFMLSLLFSSNYPGLQAPLWQYFGASLEHSMLALCFLAFLIGRSDAALSFYSLRDKSKLA